MSPGLGTTDVCTEPFRPRQTKMKYLLTLCILCWSPRHILAAERAEPWGGGWGGSLQDQVQVFNLIVINKQCRHELCQTALKLFGLMVTETLYIIVSCFDQESCQAGALI